MPTQFPNVEPTYTTQEAMHVLRISRQTITILLREGAFPRAFKAGLAINSPWRIPRGDIVAFQDRRKVSEVKKNQPVLKTG